MTSDELASQSRGRREGSKALLDKERQAQARAAIIKYTPDELDLGGYLWTRGLARDLIAQQHGVLVSTKTAGRYLHSWGFTPKKPTRRAFEQNKDAVVAWV